MAIVEDTHSPLTNNQPIIKIVNKSYRTRRSRLLDYLATRNIKSYHNADIINLARDHPPFLYRMNGLKKLPIHDGCVNTICWNKTGEYILSGSDDRNLCITKPTYLFDDSQDYTVLHKVRTHHHGNIFSAQFLPNSCDSLLASASSEGPVIVHDINSVNPSEGIFTFNCHTSAIYEVATLPNNDRAFLTCGDDKTVRLFDLRCHRSCSRSSTCPHPALIRNSFGIATLSVHPINPYLLLVGRTDGLGLVYDRRKLPDTSKFSREQAHIDYLASIESGKEPAAFRYLHPMEGVVSQFIVPDLGEKDRLTSLCYSPNGQQVLASHFHDYIYLYEHDKSSNIKLVQTLPKKRPKSPDDENNSSENAHNRSGQDSTRATRRIRLRGDWSDTGVNSVPYWSRSVANSSQQTTSNLLLRMTEIVCDQRLNGRQRFVPSPNMPERIHIVPGRVMKNRDDREHDDDKEENEDEDEDDDDEEKEDDEDEKNESNNQNAGNTFAQMNADCPSRSIDETINTDQAASQPEINQKLKLKFKKMSENLKDKYDKIPTFNPRVCYQGHRNCKTIIKEAIFWGDDYIMSGSDCGRIMVWEKETAKLVMAFPADERVVNCLAPNPHYYALASCGIDYDVKLWSTQSKLDCPMKISDEDMEAIVQNNEAMLTEAKETKTVPLHLLFRFLASYAQNR